MAPATIIIVHRGNPYYLAYCLRQARYTNPQASICLLGDDTNRHLATQGIFHFPILHYWAKAERFMYLYKHLSDRPYTYELFCLQRWFVLLEFMQDQQLANCIHLDSDVLLFDRLDTEDDYPANADTLGFVHWIPHVLYVGSQAALQHWCGFIEQHYLDTSRLRLLEELYFEYLEGSHASFVGVSDMTLLELYQRQYAERTVSLLKRRETDTAVHDDNVNDASGFLAGHGLGKRIIWQQGVPFATYEGRLIRLRSLHCQGNAKTLMPLLSTFPKAGMQVAYWGAVCRQSLPQLARNWCRSVLHQLLRRHPASSAIPLRSIAGERPVGLHVPAVHFQNTPGAPQSAGS
ncbi:hypothetical protein BN8_06398 [Fibrisoma limi BUZ 3]|uniref:Nucleotide-diphospho-sugar transferase domain-containing protein n=1 Tax=Fibrisoma limi BUZ 3 TaxID=1185876 RepID=I2GSX4_9BACT|nr:hypothetical protein BN8_06398 [Fibrisoma limi BUZ 3]